MDKSDIIKLVQKTYPDIDFLSNYKIPKTYMVADLYYPPVELAIFIHQDLEEQSNENFDDPVLQSLGYRPCYFFLDEEDPKELASFLTDIEYYFQMGDDDITVENIKKNCEGFLEIEEFANKMGLQIINACDKENPYQIRLSDAKEVLNIMAGSEKEIRLMKLFYSDIEDEFPEGEEENGVDLNSDNESLHSDDGLEAVETPEIVLDNPDTANQLQIERDYVCFNLGEDYIIQGTEFLLTREAFSRLAIKANTPEGKYISKQFHLFLDMIRDLIQICERRKTQLHTLLNKKRAKCLLVRYYKRKIAKQKKKHEDKVHKLVKNFQSLTLEIEDLKDQLRDAKRQLKAVKKDNTPQSVMCI